MFGWVGDNGKLVSLVFRLSRSLRKYTKNESADEPSLLQIYALHLLNENPKSTMKILSDYLSITLASSTILVDRLVGFGWVRRLNDNKDRRLVLLELSREGKKEYLSAVKKKSRRLKIIFDNINPQDKKELIRILSDVLVKTEKEK